MQSTISNRGRLMPTDEAWKYCGVSRDFFKRAVQRGEIAIHHVGRVHRFTREDLDAWLDTIRVPPKSAVAPEAGDGP